MVHFFASIIINTASTVLNWDYREYVSTISYKFFGMVCQSVLLSVTFFHNILYVVLAGYPALLGFPPSFPPSLLTSVPPTLRSSLPPSAPSLTHSLPPYLAGTCRLFTSGCFLTKVYLKGGGSLIRAIFLTQNYISEQSAIT